MSDLDQLREYLDKASTELAKLQSRPGKRTDVYAPLFSALIGLYNACMNNFAARNDHPGIDYQLHKVWWELCASGGNTPDGDFETHLLRDTDFYKQHGDKPGWAPPPEK